jgi:hypothetical protein
VLLLLGLVLLWPLCALLMLVEELDPSGMVAAELLLAWLPLLHESEIMLTEVTCSAPPLDCVPCTST